MATPLLQMGSLAEDQQIGGGPLNHIARGEKSTLQHAAALNYAGTPKLVLKTPPQ